MQQGSVFKVVDKNGKLVSWAHRIQLGRDENGRKIQPTKQGFATKRDAQVALELFRKSLEVAPPTDEPPADDDPRTFAWWLKEYLTEHCAAKCEHTTITGYERSGGYALRYFKDTPLNQMAKMVQQIEKAINELSAKGGKKEKPLAPKTVREIGHLINMIYEYAIRMQAINPSTHPNPMAFVTLPNKVKREAAHLEADTMQRVMAAVVEHPWLDILVHSDFATGCRRGELLALTWPDIQFTAAKVRINKSLAQTPKKGIWVKVCKGREARIISLSRSTVEALKAHKIRQQINREKFGNVYRNDLDLVICDEMGDYLKPGSVSAKVSLLMRKLGLPKGNSLHTLRHSHGSHLLSEGESLTAVSKRLGHANTQITAEIYSHVLAKDDVALAEAWEAILEKSKTPA